MLCIFTAIAIKSLIPFELASKVPDWNYNRPSPSDPLDRSASSTWPRTRSFWTSFCACLAVVNGILSQPYFKGQETGEDANKRSNRMAIRLPADHPYMSTQSMLEYRFLICRSIARVIVCPSKAIQAPPRSMLENGLQVPDASHLRLAS